MAKRIVEKLAISWIKQSQENNGIVIRAQTGNLLRSSEKDNIYIEMTVAYHIGECCSASLKQELWQHENLDRNTSADSGNETVSP
jgi:hypothetical protein